MRLSGGLPRESSGTASASLCTLNTLRYSTYAKPNMEVHHLHLPAIHDVLVQPLENPSQELRIDCNHLSQLVPAVRVLP